MRRPSRLGWLLIALLVYMIGLVVFSLVARAADPTPIHVQRPGRCGG